jgi:hypothetical protein
MLSKTTLFMESDGTVPTYYNIVGLEVWFLRVVDKYVMNHEQREREL